MSVPKTKSAVKFRTTSLSGCWCFLKIFVCDANFWINQSEFNTWNYVWTSLNCWFSATLIHTFPLYFKSGLFYSSHWIKTVLSLSNLIQSFHKTNSSNNILVPRLPRNFETWKFNLLNRRIIKFEMAEALKKARSGHLGTITRTENSRKDILEKEPSTLTLLEISKIKSSLERCREQLLKNQTNASSTNWLKVTQSRKRSKLKSRIDDNDLRIETTIKTLEMAEERIEQAAHAAPRQPQTVTEDSQTSTSGLKLPKLSLPTFTGKYSEWTPFSDTFNSTVDSNHTLSNIQKLNYLKSSLKNEPARLLSHLPTSSANYEVAKKLLQDRYANKCNVRQSALQKF